MSTKGLFMAAALFLGLVATSCSKEQSELNLNKVVGATTVTGQVCYNSGYSGYVALSNKTLYVDVELSNYDSSASGVERYTTTTDVDGNYTVTIPCSVSMGSVVANIKVPAFTASYTIWSMTTSNWVIDNAAIYEGGSAGTSVTLYSGDQTIKNINISGPTYTTAE